MRYSFVLATLSAGAVFGAQQAVNQISDGQLQVQTSAAPLNAPTTAVSTVQSTATGTIYSCPASVSSCPGRSATAGSSTSPNVRPAYRSNRVGIQRADCFPFSLP